jgi:hypothetical protein
MNEVIERLKKQAEYVTHEGLGGNYSAVDLDEFAKLIILECSRVAKLIVCTNWEYEMRISILFNSIHRFFVCQL